MKIGIIGSGNIGGTLGQHWAKVGHEVKFSSRHPENLQSLVAHQPDKLSASTVEEAADFGEVILLATPYGMLLDVHQVVGELHNKILIDATNYYVQRDGLQMKKQMQVEGYRETQWVAKYFAGAMVSKAFNTIPAHQLKNDAFTPENGDKIIPFAADGEESRQVTRHLIEQIGFVPFLVGSLADTKLVEPDQALYGGLLTKGDVKKYKQH
ncbi:NAD(P)-binding domain-containing protein [Aquimarina sp. U1-2]|uniref:NADPH-dependent F420 reductase n=1 Tax=Aquimarina sp. U1-2 TaxID=2823141 RepID=UPI001AECF5AA|nr:NAD(P)-binding domain-containing protein [Aquimarina sp. U1-2]MBP2831859.1 NAD(P)-binding domain-containing protein [Aquimarina sp. U1-2]